MNYNHDALLHLIYLFTHKHDVLPCCAVVLRLIISQKYVYMDTTSTGYNLYIVFKVSLRRLIDYL